MKKSLILILILKSIVLAGSHPFGESDITQQSCVLTIEERSPNTTQEIFVEAPSSESDSDEDILESIRQVIVLEDEADETCMGVDGKESPAFLIPRNSRSTAQQIKSALKSLGYNSQTRDYVALILEDSKTTTETKEIGINTQNNDAENYAGDYDRDESSMLPGVYGDNTQYRKRNFFVACLVRLFGWIFGIS